MLFRYRLGLSFGSPLVLIAVGILAAGTILGDDASPTDQQIEFFQTQVKPILEQHCVRCHGGKGMPKGGLRLTSRANVLKGGDSGPAVAPSKPDESLLVQAINYQGYEMPPTGKLPTEKIDVLTKWVSMGLPWPADEKGVLDVVAQDQKHSPPPVNDETKKFWSFQPVKQAALPAVTNAQWIRNPIDAFILAKLESQGLQPNAPASKEALLRRTYYDLIGLPPEPREVDEFLTDFSPQAFEKVVDRLLGSPQYGERWGRYWLDLVRYAESNSYERDGAKPFVWRYRDYVINAFNDDKPYDTFVREQLAGDELNPATPEAIIATGYYRLGIWDDEPADDAQALFDDLDDIVQTTGQVFLGVTIGCARCHDHKLDPIPQRDYYRFLAFFRNVRRFGVRSNESVLDASVRTVALEEDRRQHEELVNEHQANVKQIESRLREIEDKVRGDLVGVENDDFKTEAARIDIVGKRAGKKITDEEFQLYKGLVKQRDRLRREKPAGMAQALCVKENGRSAPVTHVLVRGNPHVEGDVVEPGFLEVLSSPPASISEPPPGVESTGRRLALANWIASGDNPLTSRVIVNRVWQFHFGRGLVRSPSDFGFQGIPPTHQGLLDWLAGEFASSGWELKRLHRLIVLSNTYRMSSRSVPAALAKDPENNWFWRFNMRRLSAEEVRDSILAANGSLNADKMLGPSIYVTIPEEVLAGQSRPGDGWGKSTPGDEARRSIYIHVKRSLSPPILASFDAADTDNSCPVRFATTQPTQALGLLNSEFLQQQSQVFAAFVRGAVGDAPASQAAFALRRVFQREPTAAEITRGVQFLDTMRQRHHLTPDKALQMFCLATLNLNEFLYLD